MGKGKRTARPKAKLVITKGRRKKSPLPNLETLHERHWGMTEEVGRSFAQAAAVCCARHHSPPKDLRIDTPNGGALRALSWSVPDERTRNAWGNRDDTTRDGAYAVSLAVVEVEMKLRATARAETRTGADYYVGTGRKRNLEKDLRLEVSGTDSDDEKEVERRIAAKIKQTEEGESNLPAVAAVVGFATGRVVVRKAPGNGEG